CASFLGTYPRPSAAFHLTVLVPTDHNKSSDQTLLHDQPGDRLSSDRSDHLVASDRNADLAFDAPPGLGFCLVPLALASRPHIGIESVARFNSRQRTHDRIFAFLLGLALAGYLAKIPQRRWMTPILLVGGIILYGNRELFDTGRRGGGVQVKSWAEFPAGCFGIVPIAADQGDRQWNHSTDFERAYSTD